MKSKIVTLLALITFSISGCNEEANVLVGSELTVNFEKSKQSISRNSTADSVIILYNSTSEVDGSLRIQVTEYNAEYNQDFTTQPGTLNDKISVPVISGSNQTSVVIIPISDSNDLTDSLSLNIVGSSSNLIKIGTNNSIKIYLTESN